MHVHGHGVDLTCVLFLCYCRGTPAPAAPPVQICLRTCTAQWEPYVHDTGGALCEPNHIIFRRMLLTRLQRGVYCRGRVWYGTVWWAPCWSRPLVACWQSRDIQRVSPAHSSGSNSECEIAMGKGCNKHSIEGNSPPLRAAQERFAWAEAHPQRQDARGTHGSEVADHLCEHRRPAQCILKQTLDPTMDPACTPWWTLHATLGAGARRHRCGPMPLHTDVHHTHDVHVHTTMLGTQAWRCSQHPRLASLEQNTPTVDAVTYTYNDCSEVNEENHQVC